MNETLHNQSDRKGLREELASVCNGDRKFHQDMQKNHTPYYLSNELIDLSGFDLQDTSATINLEIVECWIYDKHIPKENITFITDCREKEAIARAVFGVETECSLLDYLNWNTNMKKFKRWVLNPPFDVDLKMIEMAKKRTERGGSITAVYTAISSITRKPTKKFVYYKKMWDGHVKSIKMFNGNPVFNIDLFYPCQIVHITPSETYQSFPVEYAMNGEKHTDTFASLFDITKWGNMPEYYSLEKKILAYCEAHDRCFNHQVFTGDKQPSTGEKYFVNLAKIRGNVSKESMFSDDFYTIPTKELNVEQSPTKFMWLAFGTELEAENMLKYLKTDFARFALSIFKNNSDIESGELKSVPYFPSYVKEWTKADITSELGITPAEWAFIEKVIPPYYT